PGLGRCRSLSPDLRRRCSRGDSRGPVRSARRWRTAGDRHEDPGGGTGDALHEARQSRLTSSLFRRRRSGSNGIPARARLRLLDQTVTQSEWICYSNPLRGLSEWRGWAMSKPPAPEQKSVEEILASIRRIMGDSNLLDEPTRPLAPPPPASPPERGE